MSEGHLPHGCKWLHKKGRAFLFPFALTSAARTSALRLVLLLKQLGAAEHGIRGVHLKELGGLGLHGSVAALAPCTTGCKQGMRDGNRMPSGGEMDVTVPRPLLQMSSQGHANPADAGRAS